jgi:type IV pilus assembly protein PilO
MALIPQDPRQQKILVAIIVLVGGFYLFWEYLYAPQREEVTAQEARLETLESQNRSAQVIAARGGRELAERMELYERHVRRLEQLIPAGEEVPALLNDLNDEARRMNVELFGIEPEPAQPGTFYTRETYSLRVLGEYHNVGRFLTSIASLPRIVTPVELSLVPYDDQGNITDFAFPVEATFRIETYVLPEVQEPLPETAAGGAQ